MALHLAQDNIARLLAPIDSDQLAGFVAGPDPINALAEVSDGFVRHLQGDAGDADGPGPEVSTIRRRHSPPLGAAPDGAPLLRP